MEERRRRDELMQKESKEKERLAEMNRKKEEEREEKKRKMDEKQRKINEIKQKQKEEMEAKQRELEQKAKEAERKRQEEYKARLKQLQQQQQQVSVQPYISSASILGSAQKKTTTYTLTKPSMASSASENYMPLKQIGNTSQSSNNYDKLHQIPASVKLNHQEIQNGFKKSLLFNQQIKQTQQLAHNKMNSNFHYQQKDNLMLSDSDDENEDEAYKKQQNQYKNQNNMEATYLCDKSPHENQSEKKVLQQQHPNATFTNYAVIILYFSFKPFQVI